MNPSSHCMKSFIHKKLSTIFILGLLIFVPLLVTAQEVTEEPQVDQPVITQEAVEQPTEIVTTVAPTEIPVEDVTVTPEEVIATPEPVITDAPVIEETPTEQAEIPAEATEEIFAESTEEPAIESPESDETEEAPSDEVVIIEETPVDLAELSEDFEAWTGEYWTVTDWSVAQVDESLALVSTVAGSYASITSLDWTSYSIDVDTKVEVGTTLVLHVAGYDLVMASDGRNRLMEADAVVATSPTAETSDDTTTWHHVSITKTGTTLSVIVDDVPQYSVDTSNTSPLGIFAFSATDVQGVAIDNVVMTELTSDEPATVEIISTPPPATEEPDLLAESTEEPDLLAEVTEEPNLLAESTEEPDLLAEVTEEPDVVVEATEEPTVDVVDVAPQPTYIVTNIITDGFEGDLSAWDTTASIVEVAEGNHVLMLASGGHLAPISSTTPSGNVAFAGQASILSDTDVAGSFTVTFSDSYTVEISTAGITISENGESVASVESAQSLNTWFTFAIEATAEGISVYINDVAIAEYLGTLAIDGTFVVTSNTNVMFEDVTVDSLDVEAEPLATPTPETLTDTEFAKLSGASKTLINTYLDGGEDAVASYLAETFTPQDDMGRILVDILVADNFDGETIAQLVTDAGGDVAQIYGKSLEAYVDVSVLFAITGNEGIYLIRNINRAVSTGPVGTNGLDPTWTEGYNLLGIEEWHLAGVMGAGVKVGVVDTGFSGADSVDQLSGNLSCLASTTPVFTVGGLGTSTHGTEAIEVICDMAPSASVYMFRANSAASLQSAISAARNPSNQMDVLLITLDLGANTSAGGGIAGSVDANPYGEIEAATNNGMVVIAAAGNNNKRMLVLQLEPGAGETDITISDMSPGDMVKVGWNDFGTNGTVVADIAVTVPGPDGSDSSNNPVTGLSVTTNGTGNLNLNIDPTITSTTYLQLQIVPADPTSSVQYDYSSISLGANTTNITDNDEIGNLARPADSDDVISVGAICTRPNENPNRWEFSSNGPRFDSDGSPLAWDATITQGETKPTLMSYSFVTTRFLNAELEGDAPDGDGLLSCTQGFGGTSAAASHVAGMTALLMSNGTNASFSPLNVANSTSDATFSAIRDYMQARSVDLPFGAEADGFDTDFGSGLAILGAPTYDLNDTINHTTPADLLPDNCTELLTRYVGQANLGSGVIDGGLFTPFTSIAAALNAPGDPECIVVMPGEYVTPIYVENSYTAPLLVTGYDDVSRTPTSDVIFWLRSMYFSEETEFEHRSDPSVTTAYRRRAGLYFSDTSENVEFSGFTFVAARFFTDAGGTSNTSPPQAVVMDGSTDTTVSNSQFGRITLNGIEYPGWDNIDATPILVLNAAEGARIEDNIFNDNSVNSIGFYPTLAVIFSGAMDNPVVVKGNEIYGNSAEHRFIGEWGAVMYAEGSHVDIINNAFHNNEGETILKIATTHPTKDLSGTSPLIVPTHDRRARIVGNVFLNNSTFSNIAQNQPGSLINARFAPMMYIINNTFVGNVINTVNPFGQLISRGNANTLSGAGVNSNGGSNPTGWDFWEFHSNLVYNNTFYELIGDTSSVAGVGNLCTRIPNDVDSTDGELDAFQYTISESFSPGDDGAELDLTDDVFFHRGAQNNWIVSNTIYAPGSPFGDCQTAIAASKTTEDTAAYRNQNIIDIDNQPVDTRQLVNDDSANAQDGDFQGIDVNSPFTVEDWQYYALGETYIDGDDNLLNEYSDGVDAARADWLSDTGGGGVGDPYMDNADVTFDLVGTRRILDVNNWEINWLTTWDPGVAALSIPQGISSTELGDFTVDIGAFEYSPLQFETNCVEVDCNYYDADLPITVDGILVAAVTADLEEDNGTLTFDLSTVVTGGFGQLTFAIKEHPVNYGVQCDAVFENTKGLVNRGVGFNEFFDYCPPANFYTSLADATTDNDYISFEVSVTDEAGASTNGEVRFTIDPDTNNPANDNDDADFADKAVAIGDDSPEGDLFEVVTTLGAEINVRLRPYVRFNNFFFSENGNEEYVTNDGKKLIDYPFEYEITGISDPQFILVGASTDGAYSTSPIRAFSLSDSETGSATITYRVRDARGEVSSGNELVIRSVSIIPDEGLFDDTSFIWNYSDSENAKFYTERDGSNETEAPDSGDWVASRLEVAINQTIHSTSTIDDTATFRFIGSGFTVYLRGHATLGSTFALNIFDDNETIFSHVDTPGFEWEQTTDTINTLEVDLLADANENANLDDDVMTCTTRADFDSVNPQLLRNTLTNYTITCNGLEGRKHTVQLVNTGGGTLTVDAFSIINDADLVFDDADPIQPGFHDIDNGVLRSAFDGGDWNEDFSPSYSNGVALIADGVPADVSFTIQDAIGFAIGTTYRNDSSSFSVCVENKTEATTGVCTRVEDNIGQALNGIHIPFYGLDPFDEYTITLMDMSSGFIFDDVIVFDQFLIPTAPLPLGVTDATSFDIVFGEPFGNDWVLDGDNQTVNSTRSPIGPFVAFEMDDSIDTFALNMINDAPPPVCTAKKGNCPPPPPAELLKIAVCVNRNAQADSNGTNFGNCIFINTNTDEFEYVDSTDGLIKDGVEEVSATDGIIVVTETLFDAPWGDNGDNVVEIFSLYPDQALQFNSVILLSTDAGFGPGEYTAYAPNLAYLEYDATTGTYTEVDLDDDAFNTITFTSCAQFKKGNCLAFVTTGSTLQTTGIGNAILLKMQGTGIIPSFRESNGTLARICFQEDSAGFDGLSAEDTAAKLQDEALELGGCEIFDLSGSQADAKRFVNGLGDSVHHVMIELLPSMTGVPVAMNFDGFDILGTGWDTLTPLTPGTRYETSFLNHETENEFAYLGPWATVPDEDGTHSGATYDQTNGQAGAAIMFQTSGGNIVNIVRDLKTTVPQVCTGKKKNLSCTTPVTGYSDVTICVAPTSNPNDRKCAVYNSNGNATQSILSIPLNDSYVVGDYAVSITSNDSTGFVIDAVEVLNTTADTMMPGIYQEDSSLITYDFGQTEILKNTSFENITALLGAGTWDWSTSGATAIVTTERAFKGTKSAKVTDATAGNGIVSEVVDIVAGNSYTVIARVYVEGTSLGEVEMDMPAVGDFVAQRSTFTDKWQIMRFSFTATGSTLDTQLAFVARDGVTTFFVDDVHIFKGGAWSFDDGGLTDGRIATSDGYGSKAQFVFNGTGFTVKLASDTTSGEVQICYDTTAAFASPDCFTSDNEQPAEAAPPCSKAQAKANSCPQPKTSVANWGHTVTGLALGNYYVRVQQMDNGLTTMGIPSVCTGSGKKAVCTPGAPPNSATASVSTVKVDSVEIHNNDEPPLADSGTYNEDAIIDSDNGLLLLPDAEWEQVVGTQGYSNDSFYRIVQEDIAGSLLALKVDNTDPVTIIFDINQPVLGAKQVLVCGNGSDGAIEFDGLNHNIESTDCALTSQATTQNVIVVNDTLLDALDGSGGETLFTMRSLTQDAIMIDGYSIIYGTTLTQGFYEEIVGTRDDPNAIFDLSSDADWTFVNNTTYSGFGGLQTGVDGATIDFTFEGTGVSFLMQTPNPGIPSGLVSIDISNATLCGGSCLEEFDLNTADIASIDGAITIAGLPLDTYDVTITTSIVVGQQVILDAVEIFGELQELGSLYDDAQVNVEGTPLLTFSPSQFAWTATDNDTSGRYLNNTLHTASQLGANVSFEVNGSEPTEAIIIYDGNPVTSSTNVEVCWSNISGTTLSQSCDFVSLNDASATTRVNAPEPGNYSVSITNQANGQPLIIDAIQVVEAGLMTEGIYEEDYNQFDEVGDVANVNAGNGSVMEVGVGADVTFTFEGVAFSALIVENTESFNVCVYDGPETVNGCASADIDDDLTSTSNTISAVSYGGFHNADGSDNAEWTVVITNTGTSPLWIDRVDVLGNHNELEIADNGVYEAGEPQLRYLPFGSWTKTTSFKDGMPLNNDRFDTAIPGAMAYFEFSDDFGSGTVGIEYIRQIQEFIPASQVCVQFKKGKCSAFAPVPAVPPYADADICYGEVGVPTDLSSCVSASNGDGTFFQFGSSTPTTTCTNGCWGFVQYARDGEANSLTPLDYVRLYDPDSTLTAGVYQENHPNILDSGAGVLSVPDDNAHIGFYDQISGTAGESYFYFAFEGTGLSVRTYAGPTAEDISICLIEYDDGIDPVPDPTDPSDCLRTYENEQVEEGFVTRYLYGLHQDAQYLAIIKMDSDGSTMMGLDEVTIYDKLWFDRDDLDDDTYLKHLMSGNSYPVSFQTEQTDKVVQFFGDWQVIAEQIFIRYANEKKKRDPIYQTLLYERGIGIGTSLLFRSSDANSAVLDIELDAMGSFLACATPMTSSASFGVDISAGSTCQIFTQEGRANVFFEFDDDTIPHVITIELLSDTRINIYNISLFNTLNGLGEGLYDHSAPGIKYNTSYVKVIDEPMEDEDIDWDDIGTIENERSTSIQICTSFKKGACRAFTTISDPVFEGGFSRKITANIGQGIQYMGEGGTGIDLEDATHYTAIARVYIDPTTSGGVMMRIVDGTDVIAEIDGMDLSTTVRGEWQTLRADFMTESAHSDLLLQLVAIEGQTVFFADNILLTTGGTWQSTSAPLGPQVCSGKKKNIVCVPGPPLFDAFGGNFYQSTSPGASFTFDFVGTGFELGLMGGNPTGEVQVCYSNEAGFANPDCFTYSQDDGVIASTTVCSSFKKGVCRGYVTVVNNTLGIVARGIAGLDQDTWTVQVREMDDGSALASPNAPRPGAGNTNINALLGIDYLRIYDDTDIVTVPEGSYNEDAQDGADNMYLNLYPEENWSTFAGNSAFSGKTYITPLDGTNVSTKPGPIALVQVEVTADDDSTAVVFQLGGESAELATTLLLCVDATNGVMGWDGTNYTLSNSDNCKLVTDAALSGQASITSDDVTALTEVGTHNVTVTALTSGNFRMDSYQIFKGRVLSVGLHSENLPATILEYGPTALNFDSTCDTATDWCYTSGKLVPQQVCISFKKGKCRTTGIQYVEINPFIGGAAVTAQNGATFNFVVEGSGFSLISEVNSNGLDFRVCYKLFSNESSFPAPGSADETIALDGFFTDEGIVSPVLVNEGGILCEMMTTDTNNWDTIMDRVMSTGEQYGFSFYGLPFAIYEVQVMVTTPQVDIGASDQLVIDGINVFSNFNLLDALEPGITDDTSARISYEPEIFWDSNATTTTFMNTDSTSDHAGAISQFRVAGNAMVLYQTVGDMSSDVQVCLLISNENIHCTVEAERQARLARQVSSFTQRGSLIPTTVCISFKKGNCRAFGTVNILETSPFTPVVFYGLGDDTTHTIIVENREHGRTFNLDAIQVINAVED